MAPEKPLVCIALTITGPSGNERRLRFADQNPPEQSTLVIKEPASILTLAAPLIAHDPVIKNDD